MQDNSPVDDVEVSSMLNWVFCIRCLRDCKDEVGFYASSMCHHFVCTNCLFAVGCECKKCNISTEYFEIELNCIQQEQQSATKKLDEALDLIETQIKSYSELTVLLKERILKQRELLSMAKEELKKMQSLKRENARLKNELEMPQSWRNKQLKLASTERVPSRAMTSLSRSSSVQTPRSTIAGPKSQINIPRTVLSSRQGRDFHSIAHPKPLGPPKQPSSHFY